MAGIVLVVGCGTQTVVKTVSSSGGTRDPNAQVELTQAGLDAYSPRQAGSSAANHDLRPNG